MTSEEKVKKVHPDAIQKLTPNASHFVIYDRRGIEGRVELGRGGGTFDARRAWADAARRLKSPEATR